MSLRGRNRDANDIKLIAMKVLYHHQNRAIVDGTPRITRFPRGAVAPRQLSSRCLIANQAAAKKEGAPHI
jgi:hypothetical protein